MIVEALGAIGLIAVETRRWKSSAGNGMWKVGSEKGCPVKSILLAALERLCSGMLITHSVRSENRGLERINDRELGHY